MLTIRKSQDRGFADIRAVEQQDRGSGGRELADEFVHGHREGIGIGTGTQHIVAAGADGDQVRVQFHGRLKLFVMDLVEEPTTDREVGIGEVLDVTAELLGNAVGPATVSTGTLRIRIPDALGEGIAEGDHAAPGVVGGAPVDRGRGSGLLWC